MAYKGVTQECSLKIKCSSPKKALKLTPMRPRRTGSRKGNRHIKKKYNDWSKKII